MNDNRFIAFYLPQFHPIPENDMWWGKGFTEWHNVVKAKKLFLGHHQPHLPADLGFYDLRLNETRIQQAELAKQYGIEGFCYWHYYFGGGKRLLERPFNEVVTSGEPDFPFCLAWANHSWEKKLWDKNGSSTVLIEQTYQGVDDYIAHFNELLSAFKDRRYIKINGKLLFLIYAPLASKEIAVFIKIWQELALEHGVNGFYFVGRDSDGRDKNKILSIGCDAIFDVKAYNIHHRLSIIKKTSMYIMRNWFGIPTVFRYKDAIKYMVTDNAQEHDVYPVIAPNWDHSPRSGRRSIILHNSRPEYFKMVVKKAISLVANKPQEERVIFLQSWNEWGEGNYLEPDMEFGTRYLDALKDAIDETILQDRK
jgi:lipopolysaccharide biosynthesis protein